MSEHTFKRGAPVKWKIKPPRKGVGTGVIYDDYSHEGYILVRYSAGSMGTHSSKVIKVPVDRVLSEETV